MAKSNVTDSVPTQEATPEPSRFSMEELKKSAHKFGSSAEEVAGAFGFIDTSTPSLEELSQAILIYRQVVL